MGKTLGDAAGKFYMSKNLKNEPLSEELLLENLLAKKKNEKEADELGKLYIDAAKGKQEDINSKLETLEILPMGNKVILSIYPRNPYRKVVNGSIIVDYEGEFFNPDTGKIDKQKELVGCAKVIEVGPDVKYTRPGDDVYYDTRTTYPVPFMSLGYQLTSEPQILCILNEGLKERFKMN